MKAAVAALRFKPIFLMASPMILALHLEKQIAALFHYRAKEMRLVQESRAPLSGITHAMGIRHATRTSILSSGRKPALGSRRALLASVL